MADLKLAVLVLLLCIQISSSVTPCRTAGDCNCSECCVSNSRPTGRRKRETGDNLPGTCQAMGAANNDCYVNAGSSTLPPSGLTYRCPCKTPFKCVGRDIFDIPLGEIGTCQIEDSDE